MKNDTPGITPGRSHSTHVEIFQPPPSMHDLTFHVTDDERDAGILAKCVDCPATFKHAVEWIDDRCPRVP